MRASDCRTARTWISSRARKRYRASSPVQRSTRPRTVHEEQRTSTIRAPPGIWSVCRWTLDVRTYPKHSEVDWMIKLDAGADSWASDRSPTSKNNCIDRSCRAVDPIFLSARNVARFYLLCKVIELIDPVMLILSNWGDSLFVDLNITFTPIPLPPRDHRSGTKIIRSSIIIDD